MNEKELISIIRELGGSATLEEIVNEFEKKNMMILFSNHIMSIIERLKNSNNIIFLEDSKKWSISTNKAIVNKKKNDSNDFKNNIIDIVKNVCGEDISEVINSNNNRKRFNENLQIFKPSKKDLTDINHYHYNPNALIQMFVKRQFYNKYNLGMCNVKPVYLEEDSSSLNTAWLCFEDYDSFENAVTILKNSGYKWL